MLRNSLVCMYYIKFSSAVLYWRFHCRKITHTPCHTIGSICRTSTKLWNCQNKECVHDEFPQMTALSPEADWPAEPPTMQEHAWLHPHQYSSLPAFWHSPICSMKIVSHPFLCIFLILNEYKQLLAHLHFFCSDLSVNWLFVIFCLVSC